MPQAPAVEWQQLQDNFCAGCAGRLAAWAQRGGSEATAKKKHVKEAACAVRSDATKIGLVFLNGADTKFEDARGVLQAFAGSLSEFHFWCLGWAAGAGPTTRAYIRKEEEALTNAAIALVKAALSGCVSEDSVDIKPFVGYVWERCDGVDKMAVDEPTIIGRAVTARVNLLQDALSELRQSLSEQQEQDQDSDMACLKGDLSQDDLTRLPSFISLVESALAFSKTVLRGLLTLKVAGGDISLVESSPASLEPVLTCAVEICKCIDELVVAATYPPQDLQIIVVQAKIVMERTEPLHAAVRSALTTMGAAVVLGTGDLAAAEKCTKAADNVAAAASVLVQACAVARQVAEAEADGEVYHCDFKHFGCQCRGSFEQMEAHEFVCSHRPGAAPEPEPSDTRQHIGHASWPDVALDTPGAKAEAIAAAQARVAKS